MDAYTCALVINVSKFIAALGFLVAAYYIPTRATWLIAAAVAIALLGGVSARNTTIATCPRCGHTFEITNKDGA